MRLPARVTDTSPVLTPEIARRIVGRASATLEQSISVTAPSAIVIASSNANLAGTWLVLAGRAVASGDMAEAADGVGMPLLCDDQVVGAMVLHAAPDHVRDIARVVKSLAELVIHQVTVIERLPDQHRLRTRVLGQVLRGELRPGRRVLAEATALGLDLTVPRCVVALDVAAILTEAVSVSAGPPLSPVSRQSRMMRAGDALVTRAIRQLGTEPPALGTILDDRWLVLLPPMSDSQQYVQRRRLTSRLTVVVEELAAEAGRPLCAGLGRVAQTWTGLAASFADARLAAEQGPWLCPGRLICSVDDLGLGSLLAQADEGARLVLADRVLQPLLHDRDLLHTLTTFLDCNQSPSVAADHLAIHRHTLAYRLDKIRELTGLNPRDFADAVHLYVALMVHRMAEDHRAAAGEHARPR
jgi:carbohydrate diacid regulator